MAKTVRYLEMTSPEDLRPAPVVPALGLLRVDRSSPLVRSTQAQVGEAYGWRSATCSASEWEADLRAHPLRQYWLITHGQEPAGVAYLEPEPGGAVEITAFGLLPGHLGKRLGGYALTLALQQAWATEPLDADAPGRVWLHTCSTDHPHALHNYQRRGMRLYRTEVQ
ncbi:GNAT family N-acetyltransferase [Kitasatospora cheerisanensis]|uniref:Acetyltransferase n=1 Tax=Kitasatospora cheerisanensis KCTC 2395 TaxID=1348663 RepID=A0A066YL63_9ACTN|nr:GNAT family N-acetyltransferase [Kitasatospora cheerisanensis]KDN82173.1 acetyltransferase [Kitasatospora cheerisanensis KCTC 2395]